MNRKSAVTAIVGRIKKSDPHNEPLTFSEAAIEIADALNIKHEAATMTLYGLCATGHIRCLNDRGELIEAIDIEGKPAFFRASDVRHFLTEWSEGPQPSRREAVISTMINEGVNPPRTISWKKFCNDVRDACNARLDAKGRPPFGFGDKQIQRIVKDLRSK
jgi:hypothetical protein